MSAFLRFGRFNLVGLLGAGLQLLVFSLLVNNCHWPEAGAALFAVETALLHNFCWHERFTWRDCEALSRRPRGLRFWRFHAGNGLVSLAGNAALTYIFAKWIGLPGMIAAAAAITLCAPANYFLADRWVYAGD